jgi:hypothetical protein
MPRVDGFDGNSKRRDTVACVNRMTPMLGRVEAGEDAIQSQFARMFHKADLVP